LELETIASSEISLSVGEATDFDNAAEGVEVVFFCFEVAEEAEEVAAAEEEEEEEEEDEDDEEEDDVDVELFDRLDFVDEEVCPAEEVLLLVLLEFEEVFKAFEEDADSSFKVEELRSC